MASYHGEDPLKMVKNAWHSSCLTLLSRMSHAGITATKGSNMARPNEQLSAGRLCDAAQAALTAAAEVGEERGGEWPYPLDLMGSPDQPACLAEFTHWEIQLASEFLLRLGMIAPPPKGRTDRAPV